MIHIDDYQMLVTKIKKYNKNPNLYLLAKLTEEAGEVAKEIVRVEDGLEPVKDLTSELGDLLWCVAAIAENSGIQLSEIMHENIEKLRERNLL